MKAAIAGFVACLAGVAGLLAQEKDGLELIDLHTNFSAGHSVSPSEMELSGVFQQWEPLTLTLPDIETSERDAMNPFVERALAVRFTHVDTGKSDIIYGFFAADGNAAESAADAGNRWRVHFVPDRPGKWKYEMAKAAKVLKGAGGLAAQGHAGAFEVTAAAEGSRGFLRHEPGSRYLTWTGTGEIFLKGGADSPENFLGYADFDGTRDTGAHGKAAKLDLSGEKKDLTIRFFDPFEGKWERVTKTMAAMAGKVIELRRVDPDHDMVCVLRSEW